MATFEAQVEGLTSLSIDGSSAPNQTELTQFLTDGAKEILNTLPLSKKLLFTTSTSLNGSSTNLTIGGSEIFTVTRDDGTINQPCRMIASNMSGRASDSDDMNAATATDPVYYINNNLLSVIPEPTNSNNAQVQTMAYPSVAYSDSAIARFPDDVEYLVPLYASVKSLQNKLGSKTLDTSALDITAVAPEVPSLGTVSYSTASNADASAQAVGAITVGTVSVADTSGNVPTYTKPSLTTRVNFKTFYEDNSNKNPFGDNDPGTFSISANVPVVPAINTIDYTDASNSNASAEAITSATATAPNITDVSSHAPEFIKPTVNLDFEQVNTHLDTNEDIELAQVKITELQSQLSEYSSNIQNEQNKFNKENARYQIEFREASEKANHDLQVAIANLNASAQELRQESQQTTDIDKFNKQQDQVLDLANKSKAMEKLISDNNSKMQKYSNELQTYQAEVNKEIQEYSKKVERYNFEVGQVFQSWSKTESDSLQQYSIDIQNELNEYNKENARYQANVQAETQKHNSDLQKAITQAQLDAADAQQEAQQATQVDLANKAADQVLALQNSAQTMAAAIQNNDDLLQKFNAELGKYSAQVNDEVQEYSANLQKDTAKYQWYGQQYQMVEARYKEEIQTLQGAL